MKMQVCESMPGHPTVKIIPQAAEFTGFYAYVEVRFYGWDEDGRKIAKPLVLPNVQFGEQSPAQAAEWGDIFKAASMIASLNADVMFLANGCDKEIISLWNMVYAANEKMNAASQAAQ